MNLLQWERAMPSNKYVTLLIIILVLLFSGCATAPEPMEPGATIAVWDLENVTPQENTLPNLGEILSSKIIETLKENGDFIVVEREKLLLALEELGLGSTALADDSTRLKIGNMIGARLMIFGGYQVIGDHMRMDLRVIEVETSSVVKAGQKTVAATDLPGWLEAAKNVTKELIETN